MYMTKAWRTHQPDTRSIIDVDEVEHARLVSEPGSVVEVRPREDGADASATLRERNEESSVTDLHGVCRQVYEGQVRT